jgi:transglutaminase-like putative cysteine protease
MTTSPRTVWEPLRVRIAGARWHTAAVTWAAVMLASLSIQPLLDGAWWIARTGVVVAGVVAVGGLVRTARLPAPLQPLLQALGLMLLLAWLFTEPEAGWGWLLGPTDLDQLRDLAAQGRDYAAQTMAPAGANDGLLLLVVAGIGLVAIAVDTLAAGLDLPGLALVPLGALFVMPWAINEGWAPSWAFAAVAFGWFGILATTQRDRANLWSVHARPGSTTIGVAVAALTTTVAALAGGMVSLRGPALPVDFGSGMGEGSVQIDALVSLRRSLVNNDDRVVLTYSTSAPRPDYLRLAVLEQFDGTQWLPTGDGSVALGPQPLGAAAGSDGSPVVDYRLDVGPLRGTTLPSPPRTIAAPNDYPVAFDLATSLPVRTDGRSVEGSRAVVVAQPLLGDAESLRAASQAASGEAGAEPPEQTVQDPAPLVGEELGALAQEVAGDAATPFDQAVALQRWFTVEGGFRYSTEIAGGSGEDALADFLDERIGYCEQFAATMALMARSLGIPSRVVVGFTQGRPEGDRWVVRGTDAHAWPELWMGSAGWVRFEPTPGTQTATSPTYTRETATAGPTIAPSTGPSGQGTDSDVRGRIPDSDSLGGAAGGTSTQEAPTGWIVAAVALLVLLLLPGLLRMGLRLARRRRGGPEDAYREVVDSLIDLRLGPQGATPRESLAAVRRVVGSGEESVRVLESVDRIQRAVEWQRYGPGGSASLLGRASGSRPSEAGQPRAGTAVVDRVGAAAPAEQASGATPRPGALNDDVRTVRSALGTRAGMARRLRAILVPASLLGAVAARVAGPDREGTADS